ncbi:DJ-1/PfpI family protein [Streptomyces sp. S.PNR 29]|uniref:DJ-1/PfpI family protein n=1 Tax=Streptomyces sp. S.PNR 29 TaxID=2973805 RepID=UPI0025AEFF2F|nr:DJ-1/PfpI family protein [Streptomyces sp. S.PNR 29]MDN0198762.1 DJ-1/PfpI family protein [Streptomyces sp. S.PNR 29]
MDRDRRRLLRGVVAGGLGAGLVAGGGVPAARAAQAGRAEDAGAREPDGGTTRVAVLLYDGFTALDAVGPYEVLCRVPGVTVTTVAERSGRIRTDTGELGLVAERSLADVTEAEVLLVPGGGERGVTTTMADRVVLDWIRHIHRRSVWTTSVCTGSLILGAAGLLRGLPATTYWASRSYLAEVGAVYTPGRFVEAGKVITAAGVSAGIDVGLHLAARLAGEQVGQAMQLAVEYDPDPPFDTGSPEKATPELQRLALRLIDDAAV